MVLAVLRELGFMKVKVFDDVFWRRVVQIERRSDALPILHFGSVSDVYFCLSQAFVSKVVRYSQLPRSFKEFSLLHLWAHNLSDADRWPER